MSYLLCGTYQVELPELKEKKLPRMGKYTNAPPPLWHLPIRIARIEGDKVASNGEVHSNALPPLWHLPSRVAGSESCLEWGSTLMPYLLCDTY